jgi:agmatine deiminase
MTQTDPTPSELGYRWPAEWELHRATWLVWPHNRDTWPGRFDEARGQYAEFVRQVARFEPVELLAVAEAAVSARQLLGDLPRVRIHPIPTNDSWIRDHGPIFLGSAERLLPPALLDCGYNAWGGKYPPFDLDNRVPAQIAHETHRRRFVMPMILEGGSVEGNGEGVVLTTEPCLLNPNRNPSLDRPQIETLLRDFLCADQILWLTGVVAGDDTDSHIDQIARFVNASTIVALDDPQSDLFEENRRRIETWCRATGKHLEVLPLRAPRPRRDGDMDLPASYANFYVVNGGVLVPVFGDPADDPACDLLARCFPQHEIVPIRAEDLIYGLGAFHCLSQQEPA